MGGREDEADEHLRRLDLDARRPIPFRKQTMKPTIISAIKEAKIMEASLSTEFAMEDITKDSTITKPLQQANNYVA